MSYTKIWGGLAEHDRPSSPYATQNEDVTLVGIPFDGGVGGRAGASFGPGHLRHLSPRLKTISARGHDFGSVIIRDQGDLDVPRIHLSAAVEKIRVRYRDLWALDRPLVTIGGDHSVTFPIIQAATEQGGRWGVVWIDAHPDLLDRYLESPVSHGCPLRRTVTDGRVAPGDVLLIGTRAYDREERDFIAAHRIREIPAMDFHEAPGRAFERVGHWSAELAARVDRLYVTLDIDVLDPAYAPGTGTPVGGGLTTGQVMHLMSLLPPAAGYDVVEYAPPLDTGDITGQAVLSILTEMFAKASSHKASKARA